MHERNFCIAVRGSGAIPLCISVRAGFHPILPFSDKEKSTPERLPNSSLRYMNTSHVERGRLRPRQTKVDFRDVQTSITDGEGFRTVFL